MQVIHQNEDKRSSSGGADLVDLIIYIRRVGRYIKGKYIGRPEERIIGI